MTSAPGQNLRSALRLARRELAPSTTFVDGVVLALYRVASGVEAKEVARRLDVSKQRVSQMEDEGCSLAAAARYRAACDQVRLERSQP